MRSGTRLILAGITAALAAWGAMGGVAGAAFPNFAGCPTGLPSGSACLDVQSQSGELEIKGFRVPLGHSLEIRGAIREPGGTFVPATGTNGFIAQPVNVPGGLLGIELPIGLNLVLATAELAGPSSAIHVEAGDQIIELPLKVRLSNPLIGPDCHIGTNSSPVRVHLIPTTTSPPPPNRPISGHYGTVTLNPPATIIVTGGLDVENSFSIPGASSCGLGLGLINTLINLKLGLPSAAGNNSMHIANDSAIRLLP